MRPFFALYRVSIEHMRIQKGIEITNVYKIVQSIWGWLRLIWVTLWVYVLPCSSGCEKMWFGSASKVHPAEWPVLVNFAELIQGRTSSKWTEHWHNYTIGMFMYSITLCYLETSWNHIDGLPYHDTLVHDLSSCSLLYEICTFMRVIYLDNVYKTYVSLRWFW